MTPWLTSEGMAVGTVSPPRHGTPARAAGLVASILLAVAGCGDAPPAISEEADFCERALARVDSFIGSRAAVGGAFEPEGTVVTAAGAELAGMNPLVSSDYHTGQHQNFVNLMTLVQFNEDLEPVPYLAEAFRLGPDSLSVTFELRDDVFWHDGVPTTAWDVAFTFERMTDPAVPFPNRVRWDPYIQGSAGVEVVDSFTVTFHFDHPHAEPFDAWRATAIVPRHLLSGVPADALARHPYDERCPVGNGPFVFEEHLPGERWSFRSNPAFPAGLGGPPRIERLVYRPIQEPTTALSELLTGRLHLWSQPPAELAPDIEGGDDVELRSYPFRQYTFVGWNQRYPPLSDARVRRALALATDREEIVAATLGGRGRVAQTTVFPLHWAYDPDIADAPGFDPERARELLRSAGWEDRDGDGVVEDASGRPLAITLEYNADSSTRRRVAEILEAQLARIGVDVEPRSVEYNTLVTEITESRDFEAFVMGFVSDFKMDDRDLFHSARIDGAFAFGGVRNARLDRLLDSLAVVMDRERARELWHEYQEAVVAEQPFLFLWFNDHLVGVRDELQGAVTDIRGEWVTVNDWWLRHRDPERP